MERNSRISKRIGFMKGQITVPDDFDTMDVWLDVARMRRHSYVKKMLVHLAAALVLTLPIYTCLGNFGPIDQWFASGAAWIAFDPLFRLCQSVGVTDYASIVINAMLVISFAIAGMVVGFVSALFRKFRTKGTST
jgi:hypothetical protein